MAARELLHLQRSAESFHVCGEVGRERSYGQLLPGAHFDGLWHEFTRVS